jgi:hypothetical protein
MFRRVCIALASPHFWFILLGIHVCFLWYNELCLGVQLRIDSLFIHFKAFMTDSLFEAELKKLLPHIIKLSGSQEAEDVRESRYGITEAESLAKAQAYIALAKSLGVPGIYWFQASLKSQYNHYYNRRSLLSQILTRAHWQGAIKALAAAGASIWPISITQDDKGSAAPASNPKNSSSATLECSSAEDVARIIFDTDSLSLGSCKAALSCSLADFSKLPSHIHSHYFTALAEAYQRATSTSSATSLGSLGRADKRAKSCAEIVMAHAPRLRALADEPQRSAADKTLIESLIVDATARLDAKNRKNEAVFHPDALKKSLTDSQKTRLKTLAIVLDDCPEDEAAALLLIDDCPWLVGSAQALCIKRGGGSSIAQCALRARALSTLEKIDQLGGNIWLASVQAGQSNACFWAVSEMLGGIGYRDEKTGLDCARACLPTVARMLAYGALLDGAADPVAHAVAKTTEAMTHNGVYREEDMRMILADLRSRIEALALSDLLQGREAETGHPTPSARQRSRL